MKKSLFKAFLALALIVGIAGFGAAGTASADALSGTYPADSSNVVSTTTTGQNVYTTTGGYASGISCVQISQNLSWGTSDTYYNGPVTALQNFLNQSGYMNYSATGYYGSITASAVSNFQAAHGISPTGTVGPITRSEIVALTCGVPTPITPVLPIVPIIPQSGVSITNISPSGASVGSVVTITGTGFTSSNEILFAGGVIPNVSPSYNYYNNSNSAVYCPTYYSGGYVNCANSGVQTITFTIPSSIGPYCQANVACPAYARLVTSGTYSVSVENVNGTSNSVNLTVNGSTIGNNGNGVLSITGINVPSTLQTGQTGTWTVQAVDNTTYNYYYNNPNYYNSNLQYSVNWGDSTYYTPNAYAQPQTYSQTSATFTHAYQYPGTYTATFTVSDGQGNTTSSNSTVTVVSGLVY